MIPQIEDIVLALLAGKMSKSEALSYLDSHIEMAREEGDAQALRDHFAGLAMQTLVGMQNGCGSAECASEAAYLQADAMLKARK